jgi:hypothetical protein
MRSTILKLFSHLRLLKYSTSAAYQSNTKKCENKKIKKEQNKGKQTTTK